MQINKNIHKKIMLDILSDMSSDPVLSINLGFKGGTACYFVYNLDRFSVDLDFDLLNKNKKDIITQRLKTILEKYGVIQVSKGGFTKLKYSENLPSLKIDVSEHFEINKFNTYEIKDVVSGIPLKLLSKKDMFAHKLVALKDRYESKKSNKQIANRDLYDINFFFDNNWEFNSKIIKHRTKQDVIDYFRELKNFIENKVDNKKILDGLGSLVNDKQREFIKNNLKDEVIRKLSIQIEVLRN